MAEISIQFHALPEEIVDFLATALGGNDRISIVAMKFRPFLVQLVEPRDLLSDATWRRLLILLGAAELSVRNELEFSEFNPNALRLDVGRLTPNGLEQSWLTAKADDSDAMQLWKKVASTIRKNTSAGVTAINPTSGATSKIGSFRYTQRAMKLEQAGTQMLPPAGTAVLKLR